MLLNIAADRQKVPRVSRRSSFAFWCVPLARAGRGSPCQQGVPDSTFSGVRAQDRLRAGGWELLLNFPSEKGSTAQNTAARPSTADQRLQERTHAERLSPGVWRRGVSPGRLSRHDRPENQHGVCDRSAPTRPKLSLWPSGGAAWDPGRYKRLGRSRHHALKRGPLWTGGATRCRPARRDPSARAASALLSGGAGCGGSRRLGREGEAVRGPPEERTPQFKLSGEAAAQRTRAPTAAGPQCLGRSERAPGARPALGRGNPLGATRSIGACAVVQTRAAIC
ncbi:hypothetical protein NDU88_008795 [Pleurodeles waltl]|uniref:Uncharacterized protein n=1 Tax=Pleurodeles waltl TaxID=8319 RepID=A0AAV7QT01_PLEWA|nr:hypothetical protein NDU88_008795 [Pleurodeles waltl]